MIGGMTVDISPLALPRAGEPWMVDDLDRLPPDKTMRYEIIDGSLVVSPRAGAKHGIVGARLCRLLNRQCPKHLIAVQETGLRRGRSAYFEPDAVLAVEAAAERRDADHLHQSDVLLVIEVLSTYNREHDLVMKRHAYASLGIAQYWIADPEGKALTILGLDGRRYTDLAVVRPGEPWTTDKPFPLTVDAAEIFG
jgi:Uma2 family endonuclease